MSSTNASRQRQPLFQHSTSSSLSGMETPLFKPPPRLGNSHSSINLVAQGMAEKPLPPTPRTSSSIYSVQYDGRNNIRKQSSSDALLPPQTTLQPTAYRASTSKVLDARSKRPKLVQDVQAHAISDPILEKRRLQQQDIEKTETHWSQSPIQRMKSNFAAPSGSINESLAAPNNGTKGAEKYASHYESLLHTRSAALPTFTPEPYSDYDYLPSSMSPRITDVVDRSLLPPPLSYNTIEEMKRPSSAFSSSSSDLEGFQDGIGNSLRAYARKALHLRRTSFERDNRKKASSIATSDAGPRRGSIQRGISSMHDTLAKFSITSQPPKSKGAMDINGATNTRVPRELWSPAIPITRYQQMGKKAWQSSRSSKRSKSQTPSSKSGKTSYFSNPPGERTSYFSDPAGGGTSYFSNSAPENNSIAKFSPSLAARPGSMAKKIASAFHTGTTRVENAMGLNKPNTRLTQSERRREELKKKIVVIVGDQTERRLDRH